MASTIITCNEKGIRVQIVDVDRQMQQATKDSTILSSNISSLDIVPAGRTNEGVELVMLNTSTRRSFAIHWTQVITFNGLPVLSNQDLYEKAVDALGLNLTTTLL